MASPDQVLKGVPTEVTLPGLAPGSFAAFLVAGDASCAGALAALSLRDTGDKGGGRVDADGKLEVRLSSALLHKICIAPGGGGLPASDAAFSLVQGSFLEVVDWSPMRVWPVSA